MKVGIVLSGGGIRGIAHLGVLKALLDKKLEISAITGTSAGAIVGALLANGVDPTEALKIFQQTRLLKYLRPAFRSPAFISLENTYPLFKEYISHDSFEGLKIPLTITATDFNKGKLTYFSSGELIRKILASSCIPGIFSPIKIDNTDYIDGGVLNNFPVEPLLKTCDYIIGSSCNHLPEVAYFKDVRYVVQRAAILSINHDMEQKIKCIDLLIEPKGLGETGVFDIKRSEDIFWIAHEETLKSIGESATFKNLLKPSKK